MFYRISYDPFQQQTIISLVMKITIISLVVILPFIGCTSHSKYYEQDFEYLPLSEYKYTPSDISVGEEVELLAFSGGKESKKGEVNYFQFIVKRTQTGDTVRILLPLISVYDAAGVENKTYMTPLQYDISKGVRYAYYQKEDSGTNLLLQIDKLVMKMSDTTKEINNLMDHINANQYVVVNKSIDIFSYPYKTATGILYFKEIPY